MQKKIILTTAALTATLAVATLLTLTCTSGNDDISVSVHIPENGVSRIEANYAYVEARYSASNAAITEVGVMYSTTRGRLNAGELDINRTGRTVGDVSGNTDEFGIVSGLPSVSGVFGGDLTGLKHSTIYYVVSYIKLDKATGEFYKGYFLPTDGYREFETLNDVSSADAPAAVSACTFSDLKYTSVSLSATVTDGGRPPFNDVGFCYGTESAPTMGAGNSRCVSAGTKIAFTMPITGLSENTTYYARAYITNSSYNTRYGAGTTFKTMNSDVAMFIDERDGKAYRAVEIGGVTWMGENLNYEMGNVNFRTDWGNRNRCYEDDVINCDNYGRLYDWDAAMNACPVGWHLPDEDEWDGLVEITGGRLDEFGFAVVSGSGGSMSGWWSATESWENKNNALSRRNDGRNGGAITKGNRYSVRCVRGVDVAPTYTLTINIAPVGAGTVLRVPNQARYDGLTQITITATPSKEARFMGWSEGTEIIGTNAAALGIINRDLILTANFNVASTFTDLRDGTTYKAVHIGTQTWMAENLNYAADSSWCYDDDLSNCAIYGRLYTWAAAMKACPSGWHLPSNEEWEDLAQFVGLDDGKLKSTTGWNNNSNGTDDYGFSALPGGYRYSDGSFNNVGYVGGWWSATELGSGRAHGRNMNYYYGYVNEIVDGVRNGYSARCVEDCCAER